MVKRKQRQSRSQRRQTRSQRRQTRSQRRQTRRQTRSQRRQRRQTRSQRQSRRKSKSIRRNTKINMVGGMPPKLPPPQKGGPCQSGSKSSGLKFNQPFKGSERNIDRYANAWKDAGYSYCGITPDKQNKDRRHYLLYKRILKIK